jgi:hypothetical protein
MKIAYRYAFIDKFLSREKSKNLFFCAPTSFIPHNMTQQFYIKCFFEKNAEQLLFFLGITVFRIWNAKC